MLWTELISMSKSACIMRILGMMTVALLLTFIQECSIWMVSRLSSMSAIVMVKEILAVFAASSILCGR